MFELLMKSVAMEKPTHDYGKISPIDWESRQYSFAGQFITGFQAAAKKQGFILEITHAPDFSDMHFDPNAYLQHTWRVSPFDPNGVTPIPHPRIEAIP